MKEHPPEVHSGEVRMMEEDFTHVSLTTPKGQTYERVFETGILQEANISEGDRIQLTFTEKVEPGKITVTLWIQGLGPAKTEEESQAEFDDIVDTAKGIDFDLLRKKFGSHL